MRLNKLKSGLLLLGLSWFLWTGTATAQDSILILRNQLELMDSADSLYLPSTIHLCELIQYSEEAFLIPQLKTIGIAAAKRKADTLAMVRLHSLAGDYYWRSGYFTESAEEFNQIRILAEGSQNRDWQALSFNGLGTSYYLMENYPKALEYYRLGLKTLEHDSVLLMRFYNNIANVYVVQQEMDSVIYFYQLALEYDKSHQDFRKMSISYMNMALAYDQMNRPDSARIQINYAIESAKKSNDPYQIANVYSVMGGFVYDRHPGIAIGLFLESLNLSLKSKSYELSLGTYETVIEHYLAAGQADSANYYLISAYNLRDSLEADRKSRKVNEIEANFEWAKNQMALEHQKYEEDLARNIKQNRQRTWLFILIILVATLGLILYVLFQTNLIKAKINRELEASNTTKDRFFNIMAHDLRSPISGAIGLSSILEEEGSEIKGSRIGHYAKTLHASLLDVKDLIENLLQWAQSESGRMSFNPTLGNVQELAADAANLLKDISDAKGITIRNEIPVELILSVDQNMLSTVFRNLISNAIKHSDTGDVITLSALESSEAVDFIIADTGTGIPPEQMAKLFDDNSVFTTPGTRKERGTGLGLVLCTEFVKQHKGTLRVESELGKGTRILITIPRTIAGGNEGRENQS